MRPSITWGTSCGMAKRATGPSFSGRVIRVEGPVDDRGADLEHQMRSSRRPTHLLVGAHPPVQQPLHRTLGGRRRYRLVVSPGGGVIDDQTGLPGYVSLEATKHACQFTRGRSVRRYRFGRGIEYHQGVSDEIERPLYLPVPETPTDMLDGVGQAGRAYHSRPAWRPARPWRPERHAGCASRDENNRARDGSGRRSPPHPKIVAHRRRRSGW